jgi:HPr kinase/phosphorylase
MKQRIVTIQHFANHFGLIWMSGDRDAMKREIHEISCNRPGLELTGFFDYPRPTRIVLIGNKETAFIKKMTREQIRESFDFIFSERCPGCIVCSDNDVNPYVLEIAREKNFPLFKSNRRTNDLSTDIVTYLSEELAPCTSIHGTLVDIYSTGVLIIGQSGIGKSETAMELIKKGHTLVSDDRVDISLVRNKLVGRAPELLYNMIEVRGIGIIDVQKLFGINSLVDHKNIELIIKLVNLDEKVDMERLGNVTNRQDILGVSVPVLSLPVTGARAIGDIIEVAVTNFKLKQMGYDSTYVFEERFNEIMAKGGK